MPVVKQTEGALDGGKFSAKTIDRGDGRNEVGVRSERTYVNNWQSECLSDSVTE